MHDIETILLQFRRDLSMVVDLGSVEQLKIKYLGRKGVIRSLMDDLKRLPIDEVRSRGAGLNRLKALVESELNSLIQSIDESETDKKVKSEKIDISLPGKAPRIGSSHPISQIQKEILDIAVSMGFSIQESPEIESKDYNYYRLNYEEDHPALDMQDTFYIDSELLLRSHTSSIQPRIMASEKPPLRIISTGKCYRNETVSSRSHVFFHQADLLYIDKDLSMADLISTQHRLYNKLFGEATLRVRPSYFPFVKPGIEIDILCTACSGKGCSLCKHSGYVEIAGAGMVHPNVLLCGAIDPDKFNGWACGIGLERIVMLRHGVRDIRLFSENTFNFLDQFRYNSTMSA